MSTGLAWQKAYQFTPLSKRTYGLHHFNKGHVVQRTADGVYGRVLSRTALTARVLLETGETVEIEQLSKEYVCHSARKR